MRTLTIVSLCALCAWFLLWILESRVLRKEGRKLQTFVLISFAVLCTITFFASALSYACSSYFADHGEPTVTILSWMSKTGSSVYHATTAAERYSLPYGPYLYLANELVFSVLGPSIYAAKLPSATLAIATPFLIFFTLKRETSITIAFLGMAYCVLEQMLFPSLCPCPFWVRPDPYLIFWVGVGLLSSRLSHPFWASVLCGLSLGISVDLKIHAILYFLPVLVLLWQKHQYRGMATAALTAMVVAVLPFALASEFPLSLYLGWLREATKRNLTAGMFQSLLIGGVQFALPCVLAALGFMVRGREVFLTTLWKNRVFVVVFAGSVVLMFAPASKAGAGMHHLFPFVTIFAFLFGKTLFLASQPSKLDASPVRLRTLQAVGTGVAIAAALFGGKKQFDLYRLERTYEAQMSELSYEMKRLIQKYPDKTISMGYGDDSHYKLTFCRPLLTFLGNRYTLDAAALMDMQQSGASIPEKTLAWLRSGNTGIWLIPTGNRPFSMNSYYGWGETPSRDLPLFDASFRRLFLEHYEKREATKHFDVWVYRGLGTVRREYASPLAPDSQVDQPFNVVGRRGKNSERPHEFRRL